MKIVSKILIGVFLLMSTVYGEGEAVSLLRPIVAGQPISCLDTDIVSKRGLSLSYMGHTFRMVPVGLIAASDPAFDKHVCILGHVKGLGEDAGFRLYIDDVEYKKESLESMRVAIDAKTQMLVDYVAYEEDICPFLFGTLDAGIVQYGDAWGHTNKIRYDSDRARSAYPLTQSWFITHSGKDYMIEMDYEYIPKRKALKDDVSMFLVKFKSVKLVSEDPKH